MNQNNQTLALIERHPLFKLLHSKQRECLLEKSQLKHIPTKGYLFRKNDTLDSIFICITGMVKLALLNSNGDEKIVEIILPNHSIAEAALFSEQSTYPINAIALTDSTLLSINSKQYLSFLRSSNALCLNLLSIISRKNHLLLSEISHLTLHNALSRTASYLLRLSQVKGADTFELDTPKYVIASRLSLKPETFSRTLKHLIDEGVIEVKNNIIVLLRVDALQAISQEYTKVCY